MSRFRTAAFVAVAALLGASACAPTIARQGFQVMDAAPREVKVGEDTKSSVLGKLGSPSAVSTFEPNIWFYVSQITSKMAYKDPKLRSRDVVAITFADDEKVEAVNAYDLSKGYRIAYSKAETPTRGRQITVLEQLLGNVGRGGMLPQEEDVPGRRPGQ